VRVAPVKRSPGVRHLVLQGEARPFAEVTLYAKVAGYLRDLRVDKGDRVRANQVLATVTAPSWTSSTTPPSPTRATSASTPSGSTRWPPAVSYRRKS